MKRKEIKRFFLVAFLALATAQLGSLLVYKFLPIGRSVELLPFLNFTHVRNLGGIFGLFQGKGWIFGAVSLLFLVGLVWFVIRDRSLKPFEYICYGLILGGGGSNIVDRLIYGSVIDFIDVRGIPYWKYIFNTADMMIHLGIWPLLLYGFFAARDQDPETAS